jgi:hypothetical protein
MLPLEWSAGFGVAVVDEHVAIFDEVVGVRDFRVARDVAGGGYGDDARVEKALGD